ncbi:MAG TPA: ABC transporter ATP-binding protein [Acidimicrobiales bacterium]|jgi:branched-chain amino acid transport system ATP-binding protein
MIEISLPTAHNLPRLFGGHGAASTVAHAATSTASSSTPLSLIIGLVVAGVLVLSLVPAELARRKGLSFLRFYVFGLLAVIPALAVALFASGHQLPVPSPAGNSITSTPSIPARPAAAREFAVPSPGPLLSLSSVTKSFGGIVAVHGISFDVAAGESVGLVGPNGAGKTTLFNCVCGQLRPEGGTVIFDGVSLHGMPTFKRARLGIGRTYQKVEVFTDMTVRDHLLVAERARRGESRLWKDLMNQSKPTADELRNVEETLELVGISHLADTSVNALGLGNCRLVELARALAAQPKILLADEPSSGLDLGETAEVAAVLRTVQRDRGTAVLLVEHDLSMVGEVVDRTVVMDLGAMLAEGSFDEVMADPMVRQAYLGQSGLVS